MALNLRVEDADMGRLRLEGRRGLASSFPERGYDARIRGYVTLTPKTVSRALISCRGAMLGRGDIHEKRAAGDFATDRHIAR